MKDETVWLTANQMAILFSKDERTIRKHINNVFLDEEVAKNNNTQKMRVDGVKQLVLFYTLDVIISVGYRVNSKNGIMFRKWANKVLKEHLLKGYTINEKRLEFLEKKVKLIDIATRINKDSNDIKDVLDVINNFSEGLDILDNYDHRNFKKAKGKISSERITYYNCIEIIELLKYGNDSKLFALERNKGLESIINNIYQSFDGKDVYETIEEKAANFLYLIVKNHSFIDGNKRIAATLFIYFLHFYNILTIEDKSIIDNNTLAAITLLIAESNPKEKEIIVDLIQNILGNSITNGE